MTDCLPVQKDLLVFIQHSVVTCGLETRACCVKHTTHSIRVRVSRLSSIIFLYTQDPVCTLCICIFIFYIFHPSISSHCLRSLKSIMARWRNKLIGKNLIEVTPRAPTERSDPQISTINCDYGLSGVRGCRNSLAGY